jgi:drug/metabolite transporter (DMT)-like permease
VRRIVAAALAVSLLWGSGWLFMKLGVASFPPFLLAGVRGALAGLILVAFVRWKGTAWPVRRDLRLMLAIGVLMLGISNGITFWGQSQLSSSTAALVWCAMPFFTAIFSHVLLAGQRLNTWRLLGLVLGFSGVWLILSSQQMDLGAGAAAGKIAIVVSSMIWALSLVLNKRFLPDADSATMTGVQLLAGGLFLVPVGLVAESTAAIQITPTSIFAFLMLLIGQGVVAYLCYYYLLSKVSATGVSMLSFVTPAIAVFLGVVLLGEQPYWQMYAGLALIALGIITVNMLGQRVRAVAPQ